MCYAEHLILALSQRRGKVADHKNRQREEQRPPKDSRARSKATRHGERERRVGAGALAHCVDRSSPRVGDTGPAPLHCAGAVSRLLPTRG